MTRNNETSPLRGDYLPHGNPDPIADTLARVYALILSWTLPQEDERGLRQEEETE